MKGSKLSLLKSICSQTSIKICLVLFNGGFVSEDKENKASMSLQRVISCLPKRTYFPGFPGNTENIMRQNSFQGLFNAYVWDSQCGFGYTKDDKLVLVNKNADNSNQLTQCSQNGVWYQLMDPVMEMDHISLRDELQMKVLSYDNDAIQPKFLQDLAKKNRVPIYKADCQSILEIREKASVGCKRRTKDD